MKSAMRGNRLFATNPSVHRPRSTFVRPSDLKTTMEGGTLVPVYWDEVLPGDTMDVKATFFGRLATPIVPIMDNAYLETFWVYAPLRILWDNFVKQQGEQANPGDSTNYLTPILTNTSGAQTTPQGLWDYFGHPCKPTAYAIAPTITSLHMRMYNKFYNEWIRDQDIQMSVPVPTGDGPDDYVTNFTILTVNKFHDYFTSLRPAPQKGTAPTLGFGGQADVWGSASTFPNSLSSLNNAPVISSFVDRATTDGVFKGKFANVAPASGSATLPPFGGSGTTAGSGNFVGTGADAVFMDKAQSLTVNPSATAPFKADLAAATGFTLNAFRELVVVQRVYEADMRGGTRYNEGIYVHFGVVNPDNRVNRTLFLGSGKSYVNVFQVAQTSETDATTPQGNLAAYGTVSAHGHGFYQSFSEHGIVLGLACVRADLHYQNMVERMFTRRTRFDYYTPEFANLGEQAVLRREANYTGTAQDDEVLGYAERWAEYRFKTSPITGLLRSQWTTTLDFWHLAQNFGVGAPLLNSFFIQENAPWDRVVAVPSEPTFILNGYVENRTTRVMPIRSIPGLTRI